MAKKKQIIVTQSAVFTKDNEGKVDLLAKAKESLNTLHKYGIGITILIKDLKKDDATKILNDNHVDFDKIEDTDGIIKSNAMDTADAIIVGEKNIVSITGWDGSAHWSSAMEQLADRLYGKDHSVTLFEQDSSDKQWKEYVELNNRRNKVNNGPTMIID